MRAAPLLILLIVPFGSRSLAQEEMHLVLRFSQGPTEDQEKIMFESLRDLEPTGTYRYDRTSAELDLRSTAGIAPGEYIHTLSLIPGLATPSIMDQSTPVVSTSMLVDWPGFPPYTDTGDRRRDDLAYQELKRAWIATHPTEYEALKNAPPK